MRILVTGGAGFIGSHVVEGLLAAGHEVGVLDDLSTGRRENVPSGAPLFECDLRNRDQTRAVVQRFRPQAVSHQAAQASVAISMRDPARDAEVNVLGGIHLLDACTEPKSEVERVVFASTGGAIYGEVPEGGRADELSPPRPASPYAIHKLAFEQLLGVYRQRGVQTTVLRYANVYGPRQDPHGEAGVVAIFFDAARSGARLRVNARRAAGDGGCIRDYVYVADVARANLLALAGSLGEPVLNIGTGVPTTTRELALQVLARVGREPAIDEGPPRAGDLERSVLEPGLCRRYLGSLVDLGAGLDQTRAFYASER